MTTLTVHRATGDTLEHVKNCCVADHYLHRYPDPRSLPFGYYLQYGDSDRAPDGRL